MCKEIPVEMLWLRCGLRVMDGGLVTDMNAVFRREGILGSRIVHCSAERVVDMQGELISRHGRVEREKLGRGGGRLSRWRVLWLVVFGIGRIAGRSKRDFKMEV